MALSLAKARSELRDLLAMCRAVEERRRSPFECDVGQAWVKVAEYFPAWREPEDLRLDAAVLNGLARVLQIQEARLRYEAGLFLADPQLLGEKLLRMPLEGLAHAFLASWHPAVGLEQVTARGLEAAKKYFDALAPWSERVGKEPTGRPPEPERWSEEDLAALGVLRREGFLGFLGDLWEELKASGPTEYWTFIGREDAARRAYGVAFLVSYGYAELEEHDGAMHLRANPERVARHGSRSAVVVLEVSP